MVAAAISFQVIAKNLFTLVMAASSYLSGCIHPHSILRTGLSDGVPAPVLLRLLLLQHLLQPRLKTQELE
jgi:hypothetical protein